MFVIGAAGNAVAEEFVGDVAVVGAGRLAV